MYPVTVNRGVAGLMLAWALVLTMLALGPARAAAWAPGEGSAGVAAQPHTFRFDARGVEPRPVEVFVAGSFNGWNPRGEAMREVSPGVFELTRVLPEGVHFYKFVLDGTRWVNDPASDRELEEPDGFGGVNSAVLVGPDARRLGPARPDHINEAAIRFDPTVQSDFNVVESGVVQVSLRVLAGDVPVVRVHARAYDAAGGESGDVVVAELSRRETRMGFDRYAAVVEVPGLTPQGTLHWCFELTDGSTTLFLHPPPVGLQPSPRLESGYTASGRVRFATPSWARHVVWYQIFPERFRNGEPANDPGAAPYERLIRWQADWWATQPGEVPGAENFYRGAGNVWQRRYGGDIQGIREKLGYLRELGVTALYLNPVFEAASMHKYDARDFRHIDGGFTVRRPGGVPAAGEKSPDPATWEWTEGDKLFLDFVAEARRMGFRVVLDLVCNHVGRDHPYFRDVMERGPESPYASWFEIERFADVHPTTEAMFGQPGGMHFRAWDGPNGLLPVFRHDPELGLAPGPFEHMMAITRRWMAPDGDASRGIDGWRLDVANEVPSAFWRRWRQEVKRINPDALIIGEIWTPATPWLQGDQFDGVMNYQYAMAAQRFFVNQRLATTPSQFAQELHRLADLYPRQATLVLMNLHDSHDTDRLASMFVNPDRPYDGANRLQDNGPDYSIAKPDSEQYQRMIQAIEFQMTSLGAPMLYYGTEAGMWSPDDPSNRQPFVWKDLEPFDNPEVHFNDAIFAAVQRAIALRHTLPVLRTGDFRVVHTDDAAGLLVVERRGGPDVAYVVVHRSGREHPATLPLTLPPGTAWVDLLSADSSDLVPADDPAGRAVLARRDDAPRWRADDAGTLRLTLGPWQTRVLVPAGE